MTDHPDSDFGRAAPNEPRRDQSARVPTGRPGEGLANAVTPMGNIDIPRLRESMDWSTQQIIPFRQNHADAIRYFAGNRYGRIKTAERTPINMMRLAIDIWGRQLVSQDPRCLVLTRAADLRMSAHELELATNHLLAKMEFGRQLSSVVRSALFTMGLMKVGLTSQYLAEATGIPSLGGQPYAEPILFEDWLHDMNARRIEEAEWMANRYRIPYDVVMDNPAFSEAGKAAVTKGKQLRFGESAVGRETRRESDLSTYRSVQRSEYRDHVELWDVYFPQQKLFLTFGNDQGSPALEEREWTGPATGPYHILTFSDVPGNLLPAAPAQHLFDIQDLLTSIFNQLGRQALRQKTLTIVDGPADADGTGDRIMEGDDGQVIRTSHVESVREMKYGGIDPGNLQFAVWLKETMNYLGGNLDSMGGLAQQAGTLGQEQLIAQSSSEMLRDMQSKVLKFTKTVMADVAWYMYTNPVATYQLEKKIEDFGNIPFSYGPEKRTEDFYSFYMDIQPFSLRAKTPQERLSSVMNIVQSIILPLAPQLNEWGIILNMKELIEIIAKYSDLPELTNILSSQMPLQGQLVGAGNGQSFGQNSTTSSRRPLQSPNTTRNYVRENVSTGGTTNEREGKLMEALSAAASKGNN